MSILIKKMEMPKGCWACPFAVGKHYECLFTRKSYNWGLTTRPSDCPLIEVQSPHGRLIDADAFKNYIRDACEDMKHLFKDNGAVAKMITESFCKDIDEQPAIIEAEWSET